MKKILFISLLLLLFSCKKEEECEKDNISYIDINNADNESYYMYVDEVYKQIILGNTYLNDYEVSAGYHKFTFKEIEWIFVQDVYETDGNYNQCDHKSIVFGN
ncbi:MAG: hypothetical protein H8E84_07710 [Flavobacteriales bacterium]|nr:hypothetical protein [Flavobacteriales bacterium]